MVVMKGLKVLFEYFMDVGICKLYTCKFLQTIIADTVSFRNLKTKYRKKIMKDLSPGMWYNASLW